MLFIEVKQVKNIDASNLNSAVSKPMSLLIIQLLLHFSQKLEIFDLMVPQETGPYSLMLPNGQILSISKHFL